MRPHVFSRCVPVMAAAIQRPPGVLAQSNIRRQRVVNTLSQHIWGPAQRRKGLTNPSPRAPPDRTVLTLGKGEFPCIFTLVLIELLAEHLNGEDTRVAFRGMSKHQKRHREWSEL